MRIAPTLIKTLLEQQDFNSWSLLRRNYFPYEYRHLYDVISRFIRVHREIPSPDQLRLFLRDKQTQLQLETVLKSPSPDLTCEELIEYLKDAYVQEEILGKLSTYIQNSVAFETASESIEALQQIAADVEEKASLTPREQDIRYIELFEPKEISKKRIKLGLNREYDSEIQFMATDYILIGGRRGAGKSITCSNIAHEVVQNGKSALYFTIEMDTRSILQRAASIATGIPNTRIRKNDLSHADLMVVAEWWANRYENGREYFHKYKTNEINKFSELHRQLSEQCELVQNRLDIVYDSALTLGKIEAEVKKRQNLGIVIVDYVNQIKNTSSGSVYDWIPQMEASKFLKALAQDYEVPVISPYQVDKTGEARFSKGILDSADAAFSLDAHSKEDACITFKCEKMRNEEEKTFTSGVDWACLKIGPESASPLSEEEKVQRDKDDI